MINDENGLVLYLCSMKYCLPMSEETFAQKDALIARDSIWFEFFENFEDDIRFIKRQIVETKLKLEEVRKSAPNV